MGDLENHNTLKNDSWNKCQFGLDSKWGTTWWTIQFLIFFLACTEVNAYMAMKYFFKMNDKFIDFQGEMAEALINNS